MGLPLGSRMATVGEVETGPLAAGVVWSDSVSELSDTSLAQPEEAHIVINRNPSILAFFILLSMSDARQFAINHSHPQIHFFANLLFLLAASTDLGKV